MIDRDSTLEDVCFAVSSALEDADLHGVLTGGSAAAIYSSGTYASYDADFVIEGGALAEKLEEALRPTGFRRSGAIGMYDHPESRFTIDFPKGPLAVGRDYLRRSAILMRDHLRLRILTPTDCVRDRLAHYYFWDDFSALRAAVQVAQSKYLEEIDLVFLSDWTRRESEASGVDYNAKLSEFLRRIERVAE